MNRPKREAIARELAARPNQSGMPWGWLRELLAENEQLESQLAKLTLERDQLRDQCAYNQLTIDALTAKLAKADRMDQ